MCVLLPSGASGHLECATAGGNLVLVIKLCVRHTAAGLGVAMVNMLVLPFIASLVSPMWRRDLLQKKEDSQVCSLPCCQDKTQA